jgi:putative MFS transporter
MSASKPAWRVVLQPAVIVGALGYFVDIYDLILFSILRIPSLRALGYEGQQLIDYGILLLNCQMAGMLVGGVVWGILGDRIGRIQLLFGSILLYSVANIANGLVGSVESYAVWRFIAGVGLAGELGGSITLVSEVLSKELRGYGTAIVATIGTMGAVVGGFVADLVDWRTAYFIGGGLGLLLLFLRMSVAESGMFNAVKNSSVKRGSFLSLFTNGKRFRKYMRCILIGVPGWFVIGILVTFSPELAKALEISGEVKAAYAVIAVYLGLVFGDLASGFISQWLGSRKKVVAGFLVLTAVSIAAYLMLHGESTAVFYTIVFCAGFSIGYWAVFVTIAAEQFGTNIRATVATSVPNFVRAAVIPITLGFNFLKESVGIIPSAAIVGVLCLAIAALALMGLEETHGKDLDYHEVI